MSIWLLLLKKELLESARNYKWIWIPLVFLLIGLMNPITSYFMPQILEASGITAEAAQLIPVPSSTEIMVEALSQFGTLGLLILALSFMGIVAAERQSGSAIMVLVKPVSHTKYILAKWTAMSLLTLSAFGIGYMGTWYYTNLLFTDIAFPAIGASFLVYALWLLFVNTMILLFSCLLKSQAGTAFIALAIAALLSVLANVLERFMSWSPGRLTAEAGAILTNGHAVKDMWITVLVTMLLIASLLWGAITASKLRRMDHDAG